MSKKTREIKAQEEATLARATQAVRRTNLRTLLLIGAIAAAGLGLAFWLTNDRGAPSSQAQAQKAVAKAEIAEADLMKAGPLPENILGDANAKVTIVEYASMTCPHCASFHRRSIPS